MTPRRLLIDQPASDPLEAGPPEGPRAGSRQDRSELLAADAQQLGLGIIGHPPREAANELVERPMDDRAELGTAGIGIELVQGPQPEDMAGIDRIGIAQPGLDLRHGKLSRPRRERRTRLRWRKRPVVLRPIDQLRRLLHHLVGLERAIETDSAQYRVEPKKPARRHGRNTFAPRGAGQRHLRRADRLGKIMRCHADRPLRRGDAEFAPHLPRHPRIVLGRSRPAALVQSAENNQISLL